VFTEFWVVPTVINTRLCERYLRLLSFSTVWFPLLIMPVFSGPRALLTSFNGFARSVNVPIPLLLAIVDALNAQTVVRIYASLAIFIFVLYCTGAPVSAVT
jgi:hypothetical protein